MATLWTGSRLHWLQWMSILSSSAILPSRYGHNHKNHIWSEQSIWQDSYLSKFHNGLIINLPMLCDACSMDFKNFCPRLFVRQGDFNLAVQPTWAQQCRIQDIRSICGHYDLHLLTHPPMETWSTLQYWSLPTLHTHMYINEIAKKTSKQHLEE